MATKDDIDPEVQPELGSLADDELEESEEFEGQEGGSRSPRQVESQAGRKAGYARHTAGAKRQATREALGGLVKKHSAGSVEQKLTGPQKAGRKKRRAAKKRAVAQERKRKSRRAA